MTAWDRLLPPGQRRLILSAILVAAGVLFFFHLPEVLVRTAISTPSFVFQRDNPLLIDTTVTAPGRYYVSYGLVRAACDAMENGRVVVSSRSTGAGVKSLLLVGHEVQVTAGRPVLLTLACEYQAGFATSLAHRPIVLPVRLGKLIQLYRGLLTLGMGLGATCSLLVVSLFVAILRQGMRPNGTIFASFVFALTSLLYLTSYCQVPRLWLTGATSTMAHIVLRNWFASGSLLVMAAYLGKWRLPALVFVLMSGAVFAFNFSSRAFWPFYRAEYFLFAFTTTIYAAALFRKREQSKQIQLIRVIAVCWVAASWMDVCGLYAEIVAYNTPIFMALTAVLFIYLLIYERARLEQLEFGVKRLLAIAHSEHQPEKILVELAHLFAEYTYFARISCYLDGFLVGKAALPAQRMLRVFEKGYRKETSRDTEIDFTQHRGEQMRRALETQAPVRGRSADGGNYVVLPVGKYTVINLSDDQPVSDYQYHASLETLARLKHGLSTIEAAINDLGTAGGNLLQKLRAMNRTTSFETDIVGIKLDIHEYSKSLERYRLPNGHNPYARFISTEYLPGLARAVSGLAYPEALEGDLIAFVIIRDTFEMETDFKTALAEVLLRLEVYKAHAGAEAAQKHGFPAVRFAIGVGMAKGTVTFDEYKARTAGDALTVAQRLLDAVPDDSVMVAKTVANSVVLDPWKVVLERQILVKTDFLDACVLAHPSPGGP